MFSIGIPGRHLRSPLSKTVAGCKPKILITCRVSPHMLEAQKLLGRFVYRNKRCYVSSFWFRFLWVYFLFKPKKLPGLRGRLEPGENSPRWPIWPWPLQNSASSSHSHLAGIGFHESSWWFKTGSLFPWFTNYNPHIGLGSFLFSLKIP